MLNSAIVNHNDEIIACGGAWNENEEQMDGVIVRLEPDHLDPIIFYWDPIDTVLTILPEDTIAFL